MNKTSHLYLVVLLCAAAIYLGCIASPPSLVDDVDSVQAQVARHMVESGDWVTAHINGLVYLDKAPFNYWLIGIAYKIFGVHDWVARIPVALAAMALAMLTAAFGVWAFGGRAGFYAGLCMSTCVGLWLFTRVLLPDALLTCMIVLALWSLLRALDEEEPHPRFWSVVMAACLGVGLLVKSVIGLAFPVATAVIYLVVTRQFFSARTWQRLHLFTGALIALVIAAPWHILATLRNPPYFAWTLHSGPGQYHGFLWDYFVNEQLLRFLNRRYPRDYNTVPRLEFWLFHLIWLFPWSVYFPAIAKLPYKAVDRAGRVRVLALCWIGFIMVFFTLSTTQEYYSMPLYPALALLAGCAMASDGNWIRYGTRALAVVTALCALAVAGLLIAVRGVPTPGDISLALTHHPSAYTLSLGHMQDLTVDSFAYLRLPLAMAGVAFLIGALGAFRATAQRAFLAAALMMVLLFQASRLAMVTFDPYLSSRPLATVLEREPPGTIIAQGFYYSFSSVFYYLNRSGLLLSARRANLEYGSHAPGAPEVFIVDSQLPALWNRPERYYLLTFTESLPHYKALLPDGPIDVVAESGGKLILTNHPLTAYAPSAPGPAIAPSN
ncbi:MAG TPA: glycosyltransferase family 39 protein [Candidatus Acidoferrum sp.]|nr:glycosyltransferase family 39 protein [Candidatus Acidoferrum sp.]